MSGATACAKVPKTSVKDFVETVLWKNCLCPGVKPVSIFDLLVRLERPLHNGPEGGIRAHKYLPSENSHKMLGFQDRML